MATTAKNLVSSADFKYFPPNRSFFKHDYYSLLSAEVSMKTANPMQRGIYMGYLTVLHSTLLSGVLLSTPMTATVI